MEDNLFENEELKFIWGIKSFDDLSAAEPCLYTMNDIDIIYFKVEDLYHLEIETAYIHKDYKAECEYLKQLLRAFEGYMNQNNLNKEEPFSLFFCSPATSLCAPTIEELYTNFRIFVLGYCALGE